MLVSYPGWELTLIDRHDPALCLLDERGRRIRAVRRNGRTWVFLVPGQIESLRLVSRRCRLEIEGESVVRGVLVGAVTFFDSRRTTTLTAHLAAEMDDGWCESPGPGIRWTGGNAVLQLHECEVSGPGVLSVEILSEGPYEGDV